MMARARVRSLTGHPLRRRGDDAQAVIETAIVLPLMLFLICGFVALMLQVQVQQQMDSAVTLAAESTFQVPRSASEPIALCPAQAGQGAPRCGDRGLPTRCRFAWQTFEGSMGTSAAASDANFDHPDGKDPAHHGSRFIAFDTRPLCVAALGSAPVAAHPLPGWPQAADVQCNIDFDNRHKTACDATATLHYETTPLAWAIFWRPTVHAHAEALAPPFRQ